MEHPLPLYAPPEEQMLIDDEPAAIPVMVRVFPLIADWKRLYVAGYIVYGVVPPEIVTLID